jgi:hypothetical protein
MMFMAPYVSAFMLALASTGMLAGWLAGEGAAPVSRTAARATAPPRAFQVLTASLACGALAGRPAPWGAACAGGRRTRAIAATTPPRLRR